jgi:nicotinamidase-related amidase
MATVVLALHYQNEVLHPAGLIKVGMTEGKKGAVAATAGRLLAWARASALPVISVRIAFRPDYADVIQNCKIFRKRSFSCVWQADGVRHDTRS